MILRQFNPNFYKNFIKIKVQEEEILLIPEILVVEDFQMNGKLMIMYFQSQIKKFVILFSRYSTPILIVCKVINNLENICNYMILRY